MASVDNGRNCYTDYELLAIFDDISALSHLEDYSRDHACLNFFNELRPTQDNCLEEKVKERPIHAVNDQDDSKIFAVPKVYTCMYCYKRFYNQLASHMHQVCHAKQQLQCPYCKTRSYNASILRRHFQYFHPYALKRVSIRTH